MERFDRRTASFGATSVVLPHRFGRYLLLERIGLGGMAEVFLAHARDHASPVVVKRLRVDRAGDASMNAMFIDEAKLAVELHHPNIVRVFELGESDDGGLYMAMEYVDGVDLKQLLRSAELARLRIPPWFSVWIAIEVLSALEYVHGLTTPDLRPRRVVHRDVSPENIFISNLGLTKLGDFGVAKYDQRMTQTAEGRIKGKLCYMSPEQIRNQAIDERTDVFALAVVLWESLAQKRLFRGASPFEVLEKICSDSRTPPSSFAPDIPVALDACVLSALAQDPDQRTSSARVFRRELVRVLRRMRDDVDPEEVVSVVRAISHPDDPAASEPTSVLLAPRGFDSEELVAPTRRIPVPPRG